MSQPADPTSQSNWDEVVTQNVDFVWSVDFELKLISGSATHTMKVIKSGLTDVVLDTADLEIAKVEVDDDQTGVPFTLGERDPVMGSPLLIPLPKPAEKDSSLKISIQYKTTTEGLAVGWMEKEQTQGKKFPFLFTQCQPIYARALAPVQDTPSVKITYSATVQSVLPVLMSALRTSPSTDGPPHDGKVIGEDSVTYVYNQPEPIPSYLIAIASGNVDHRPFTPPQDKAWKSGVWAEPEGLEAAYSEFSEDTIKFMVTEENIAGPYRFGVYDLLVLPPSFPYGGMENPCTTFLTPTVITGDRALVDVVAHEFTHSYFGNGVTHANASHFWLNEGWTTYIERVLAEKLNSPAHRDFSYMIGYKSLTDALKLFEGQGRTKYQRLVIPFEKGEDPDDAYSTVPYEKGANFLLHIERTLGGLDVFLPFIRDYVDTFMGKSITTEQWKDHLYGYYEKNGGADKIEALDSIKWDAWLNGEGTDLPVTMEYDTSLAKDAYALAEKWEAAGEVSDVTQLDFKETDLDGYDTNQKIVFLERLQSLKPLPSSHQIYLGNLYQLSSTLNAEVRLRFYQLVLKDPGTDAAKKYAPEGVNWIVGKETGMVYGRMKFCRDVLRLAAGVDRDFTVNTFVANKNLFHPIARKMIEKDLGLAA
ncbi:metalloprotease [Marasmius fiardii PR-910]|nr:metalloprotease [Marasmius fiardii PR-910]